MAWIKTERTIKKRGARPNQFYPIFVDENTGKIKMVGDALSDEIDRNNVSIPDGLLLFGR